MVAQGTEAEVSICNSNDLYCTVLNQGSTRISARGVGQATGKWGMTLIGVGSVHPLFESLVQLNVSES